MSPAIDPRPGALERILGSSRLIGTVTALLALLGVAAFLTMNRQEDPFFPYRAGIITSVMPGGDPERIERLIVRPLERELASIPELDVTRSTIRNDVAVTIAEMVDSVYDTAYVWDRVRDAIDRAWRKFPEGTPRPTLDDRAIASTTAAWAITGSDDLHVLADGAERLRDRLLTLGNLIRVDILGDPEEQVTIALDDETARALGVSPAYLAAQLVERTRVIPGGSLAAGDTRLTLQPLSDFASVAEIERTPVRLPDGSVVPLASLAEVWLGRAEPVTPRAWFDGRPAVVVDASSEQDVMNTVAFGEELERVVREVAPEIEPLRIERMFFNPARVKARLDGLTGSLAWAMAIIFGVLAVFMGLRSGIVVSVILPLVAAITLGAYFVGGGVLHQFSVIGIVISLGILVDNAIVMVEEMQWRIDEGEAPRDAAVAAARSLAGPLGAATGTTLAAFVPMLLARGSVGDFTRALPVMIMIALSVSYLFALFVTPAFARALRARGGVGGPGVGALPERLGEWAGRVGVGRPGWMLAGAALAVAGAALVGRAGLAFEFFPEADRNQIVVDVALPEGTRQERTEQVARQLEHVLREHRDVRRVHGFVGFSGPKFYYNLVRRDDQPHAARLVAETTGLEGNRRIVSFVREFAASALPEASVTPKIIGQGPPVTAPVEVRVFQPDPKRLAEAVERIYAIVKDTPGAADVTHSLGLGAPRLEFAIDDAAALRHGVTRADVARALLGRSRGIEIGRYRAANDPVPILVRSRAGENLDPARLESLEVYGADGKSVPLSAVAASRLSWQPGAIHTRNQRRTGTVVGELALGYAGSEVLDVIRPAIASLDLPPGTAIEYGGKAEASHEANTAILQAAPLGLVALLFFLLVQFDSFRRVAIVLVTVPLAFVGVLPGLVWMGIPFGFQPLLGSIALVGIVVNNAIVLLDRFDSSLRAGLPRDAAILDAVRRRTRPILLTTGTTVAGLLPLAVSESTLWPPMAWAMIFGLVSSTFLTLFVVPALCRLLIGQDEGDLRTSARSGPAGDEAPAGATPILSAGVTGRAAAVLLASVLAATGAGAQEGVPTLAEALARVASQPARVAADERRRAAEAAATVERRRGWSPALEATAFGVQQENRARIDTPLGGFTLGERRQGGAEVVLRQPLVDAAQQLWRAPAAGLEARSEEWRAQRTLESLELSVVEAYVSHLRQSADLQTLDAFAVSLDARRERIAALVAAGRALRADELEVRLARDGVDQRRANLMAGLRAAATRLERLVGETVAGTTRHGLPDPPDDLVPVDEAMAEAISMRADRQALEAAIRSLDWQRRAVAAERLPTVGARARYQRTAGHPILPDEQAEIGLELAWKPFTAATHGPRRTALAARRDALRAEAADLERRIRVELVDAAARFDTAAATARLADSAVESARATLDTRSARFDRGRATIDDVLEAEAELARQEALREIARLDRVGAWLEFEFARGIAPATLVAPAPR